MLDTKLTSWTVFIMLGLLSMGSFVVHGGNSLPKRLHSSASNVSEKATTVEQVNKFLEKHPNALIQFHRPGCPFCVYVAPLYEQAQSKYSDQVAFLLVDISQDAKNLKNEFGFSTVPEFQYYKDGVKKHSHGSKSRKLKLSDIEALIQELYL